MRLVESVKSYLGERVRTACRRSFPRSFAFCIRTRGKAGFIAVALSSGRSSLGGSSTSSEMHLATPSCCCLNPCKEQTCDEKNNVVCLHELPAHGAGVVRMDT